MVERGCDSDRRAVRGFLESRELMDQPVTLWVLVRALATLAAVALSGWWFIFDEVRLVRSELAAQRVEMVRQIDSAAAAHAEQRRRLRDRVDVLGRDIQDVQVELGELRVGVRHIGQTTDAIFSALTARDGNPEGPEDHRD